MYQKLVVYLCYQTRTMTQETIQENETKIRPPFHAIAKSAILIVNPTEAQIKLFWEFQKLQPSKGSNMICLGVCPGKQLKSVVFMENGGFTETYH